MDGKLRQRNNLITYIKTLNLVPRGRDPFGQRRGSQPLARWDFESANHGLLVTLRRIMGKPQDVVREKCSRYISGRREICIRKSWKSKYYTQTETRRDPENNHFEVKRYFSCSPNWLRKIVNNIYRYMTGDHRRTQLLIQRTFPAPKE